MDRSLIVGDVVKRNAHETMSGTVVQTSTTATLLKPKRWPQAHSDTLDGSALESCRIGNYSLEDVLHGVNTDDLVPSSRYNLDQFVLYKSWIGRIVSKWEDFYVRLSNNSVVVPEDPEDLDVSSFGDPSGDLPAVGDFVETRKSNLRRGRWVYGAYNANIEPYGYIADIRTTSLEVDWLTFKLGGVTSPDADVPPPVTVDQDILESGELVVYDRRKRARVADEMKRLDLDTFMGDAVRFRDPAGAAVKYNAFDRIPRTDTLGFDVNTMKVVKCNTLVTVLWQDLTTSSIPSTQLIPYLDIASDEEIWPGELIGARKSNTSAGSGGKFDKYGVAQSINARDRIARVRWFTNPSALFLDDEAEIMDPEAVTGPLGEEVEEVSLYDVQTLPGMSMRLGDLVALRPSHNQAPRNGYKSQIHEQVEGLLNASDTIDWFGEVIELGLDGLLTIRLAASSNVRDIRVPWEFTFRVYSTDYDDPEVDDDDMDEEMSDEDYTDEDTDEDMPEVVEVQGEDGQWRDLVDVGDEDLEDWMTDEEHGEAAPDDADEQPPEVNGVVSQDNDEGMTDALEPVPENVLAVLPIPQQQQSVAAVSPSAFSYKSMFEGEGKLPAPEQFAILETSPPADHHFSSRTPVTNAVRTKRIQREYRILQDSLPEGIYVRTWESALDLIRVLILGPLDTPYGYAPFVIDLYLDHNYPHQPPQAFFHSWTHGTGPINPNLYEDGKICLSLLGTWPGDERNETWNPLNSTILQLVVSLVGLVFVKEPFYSKYNCIIPVVYPTLQNNMLTQIVQTKRATKLELAPLKLAYRLPSTPNAHTSTL